ncbi:MAG: class IV adenylate cyclase [Planctomycetes bacterium]|nr:class IV adenylate cyclase [Planctomycetota bacterium]
MRELECKVRLSDPGALARRLEARGWERRGAVFEQNWLFDRAGELAARGEALRLRVLDHGAGGLVTHKGPARPGPFKDREETQTLVADAAAMRAVFAAQGFVPVFYYEKRRAAWGSGACETVIDALPRLGDFAEVEAPDEDALRRALAELGLTDAEAVPAGYPTLAARLGLKELRFAEGEK